MLQKLPLISVHGMYSLYVYDEKSWSRDFHYSSTWPVWPIYMMKKVGHETSPWASTWPVRPKYMTKKVGPETFLTAASWPVQPIYRVSQEECAILREGVPYVKVCRYNQNTYVQSWTVMEIMTREKCGLLAGSRTVSVSWQCYKCLSLSVVSDDTSHKLHTCLYQNAQSSMLRYCLRHVSCIVIGTLRTIMTWRASFL
jgi:hypothetical protein